MASISALAALTVDSEPDGGLTVTWSGDGDGDGSVEVAAGATPDPASHRTVARVPATDGRATVAGPEAGQPRVFVSVRTNGSDPVVAADRHINFDGPVNFRDIGGYRTADGREVKWGRVFRSDTLVLSDEDVVRFRALGIRTVYDLRNEVERTATPNRLPEPDGPVVHIDPLVSDDPQSSPMAAMKATDGQDFLRLLYIHILERSAPIVGRILTGLADEPELPAVFHCSAGKDRTGLITGVLLSVLGVPLEVIIDDYEMTGRYRTTEHVQASVARIGETTNLAPEVVAGILEAPRPAMELALSEVGDRHGGFEAYLIGPAGGGPDLPERLRAALLSG